MRTVTDFWANCIVEEDSEKSLSKYAQDPLFVDADKSFLEKLGFEVVEDPKGLSLINAKSFLYCPFLPRYVPVLQQGEHPPIYVGNDPSNAIWMTAAQLYNTEYVSNLSLPIQSRRKLTRIPAKSGGTNSRSSPTRSQPKSRAATSVREKRS